MAKHKVLSTDADIERALAESASTSDEPLVSSVSLGNLNGITSIILRMSDGSIHGIPKSRLEQLSNVADEVASSVEITENGLGVRWPDLDLDMYVPSLLQGIYGTRVWMSSLGRVGGKVRSQAKQNAARINGLKGGRPLKHVDKYDSGSCLSSGRQETNVRMRRARRNLQRDSSRHSLVDQINGANFAALYGLSPSTQARPLPRIA
jgi:hypothetical protein